MVTSTARMGCMGGANKISRTANHLSILRHKTDKQSWSRGGLGRRDWLAIKGGGGWAAVSHSAWEDLGHTCEHLHRAGWAFYWGQGGWVHNSVRSKAGWGCHYSAYKRAGGLTQVQITWVITEEVNQSKALLRLHAFYGPSECCFYYTY